jgi:hypothetical protein
VAASFAVSLVSLSLTWADLWLRAFSVCLSDLGGSVAASFAVTFCRSSVGCLEGNKLLTRPDVKALDLKGRLSAVAWSLIMHKRWFALHDSMLPDALFEPQS